MRRERIQRMSRRGKRKGDWLMGRGKGRKVEWRGARVGCREDEEGGCDAIEGSNGNWQTIADRG